MLIRRSIADKKLTEYCRYTGLRNVLNHGCPGIDHPTMWRSLERELPTLIQAVEQLLEAA